VARIVLSTVTIVLLGGVLNPQSMYRPHSLSETPHVTNAVSLCVRGVMLNVNTDYSFASFNDGDTF
jgi:hypothetical protein